MNHSGSSKTASRAARQFTQAIQNQSGKQPSWMKFWVNGCDMVVWQANRWLRGQLRKLLGPHDSWKRFKMAEVKVRLSGWFKTLITAIKYCSNLNEATYQLWLHTTRKRTFGLFVYSHLTCLWALLSRFGINLLVISEESFLHPKSLPPTLHPPHSKPGFNIDTDGRLNVILVSTSILLQCV